MIIFFISILFACAHLNAGECKIDTINIVKIINSIPEKDRDEIKSLFKDLFKYQAFAYSLYGNKPLAYFDVSLEDNLLSELLEIFSIDQLCKEILEVYCEPKKLIKERWKIWKQYKDQFQINKYLLLEKPIGAFTRICFINKEAFKNVVNQNIKTFQKIIGSEISAEQLLTQFQSENTNVFDLIHNSESLLGILLGFGEHNATLFQQREDLFDKLERSKSSGLYKLEPIQEELRLINTRLQPLREHDFYPIVSINQVRFLADQNQYETTQLRTEYDKVNRKINEIYYKDDWFEQTLIQLTSN